MKIRMADMADYYTQELKSFLNELGEVARTMNIVEMVTPVNAAEEQQKWLELAKNGQWTNPEFQYNSTLLADTARKSTIAKEVIGKMKVTLGTVSNDDPGKVLANLVESRCQELLATTTAAQYLLYGDDCVTNAALRGIFGTPSSATIAEAHEYAECLADGRGKTQADNQQLKIIRERLNSMEFNAEQIRENFIWMAGQCNIANTRPVIVDVFATAIDVRDKSSRGAVVSIPADRKVNGMKLVELTGHEILCHWCDSERASCVLPLLGGGALKPSNEVLYEGHATLIDYHTHFFLGDKAPQQQMPFYIIAMNLAMDGMSFAEVAPMLYEKIRLTKPSDQAALAQTWTTCFRVFRGSNGENSQTKKYAFTKDRAYFEGRRLAEKLHLQQLDSVLELGTLSEQDIEILKTVVEFERRDDGLRQIKALLQRFVQHLLNDEVVF